MGRNIEQNELIRENRREQILTCSLKIFSSKGFGSSKISDIAAEAGISHGLIYEYFKTKDEIFETLVSRAVDYLDFLAKSVEEMPGTPYEKLRFYFQTVTQAFNSQEFIKEQSHYFLIMIQAATFDLCSEKVKDMLKFDIHPLIKVFIPIIIEGQRQGEIAQGDPSAMASLILDLTIGMALNNYTGRNLTLPDVNLIMKVFNI